MLWHFCTRGIRIKQWQYFFHICGANLWWISQAHKFAGHDGSNRYVRYVLWLHHLYTEFFKHAAFCKFCISEGKCSRHSDGQANCAEAEKNTWKKNTKYWCGRQTSKNLRREIFLRTQSCTNNWWTPPPSLPPSPATLRAPLFVGMFSSHWSYQSMLKLQRQFGNFRGHAKPWWGCPQWQVVTVNRYSLRTLKNDSLPFIGASGLTGSTCDLWFSP